MLAMLDWCQAGDSIILRRTMGTPNMILHRCFSMSRTASSASKCSTSNRCPLVHEYEFQVVPRTGVKQRQIIE